MMCVLQSTSMFYSPRHLSLSVSKKKDIKEVKRVRNGVIVA